MEYDIMNDLLGKTVRLLFEKKVNLEENERNWKLMLSAEKNRLKQQKITLENNDTYNDQKHVSYEMTPAVNQRKKVSQQLQFEQVANQRPDKGDQVNLQKQKKQKITLSVEQRRKKFKETTTHMSEKEKIKEWIKQEAGIRLKESLKRLNIDFNTITKNDLQRMSKQQLNSEKKNVKNELKRYDQGFKSQFGRIPVRQEKEPMRPLYIYYKTLKQNLTQKEKQSKSSQLLQIQNKYDKQKQIKSMEFQKGSFQQQVQIGQSMDISIDNKLIQLKQERIKIRAKLQNYQKQFQENHSRKIRYLADIEPVEAEYNRYREIKSEIAKMEDMLKRKKR